MAGLLPMNDRDHPNPHIPTRPGVLEFKLEQFAGLLAKGGPVKIACVGSSSTAGWGSTPPYPGRLEALFRDRFFPIPVDVLNRGKGGQEAPDQLERLELVLMRDEPALVIWQVGANAVFHGRDLGEVERAIRSGLQILASRPVDVILMDLQYVPPLLTMDRIEATLQMVSIIEKLASEAGVNVFRRFDFMRRMHRFERVSFDRVVEPDDWDRLHHSDWSTMRVTKALFDVVVHAFSQGASARLRST